MVQLVRRIPSLEGTKGVHLTKSAKQCYKRAKDGHPCPGALWEFVVTGAVL